EEIWPALAAHEPVAVPYGLPTTREALIDGVLARLGLGQERGDIAPILPILPILPVAPAAAPLERPTTMVVPALRMAPRRRAARDALGEQWNRRRPLVIGAAAAALLLVVACIVFSLDVIGPGGNRAQDLGSAAAQATNAAQPADTATALSTPSPMPSATRTK